MSTDRAQICVFFSRVAEENQFVDECVGVGAGGTVIPGRWLCEVKSGEQMGKRGRSGLKDTGRGRW